MADTLAYVIKPHVQPAVPVEGDDGLFPVRRIYCIGRNYAEHAREMGHDPDREPPFFFQKNPDSLVLTGNVFPYPEQSKDVHHEIELVVALRSGGRDIPVDKALDHVFGYAVGLDMTARDLQAEAKRMGRPWEMGKAFDHSAPISPIVPASRIGHPTSGLVWLDVNGERRQTGDLKELIWSIPEMISILSKYVELKTGDLIFTGTPAGVGPVHPGDRLTGGVDGVGRIEVRVA